MCASLHLHASLERYEGLHCLHVVSVNGPHEVGGVVLFEMLLLCVLYIVCLVCRIYCIYCVCRICRIRCIRCIPRVPHAYLHPYLLYLLKRLGGLTKLLLRDICPCGFSSKLLLKR
eukprot:XP_001705970.1 High cysteine protein [Giardia lamblia ATCC 50803]